MENQHNVYQVDPRDAYAIEGVRDFFREKICMIADKLLAQYGRFDPENADFMAVVSFGKRVNGLMALFFSEGLPPEEKDQKLIAQIDDMHRQLLELLAKAQ